MAKAESRKPADIECRMVVLGSGPGGYTAAFRAADVGLDTVLIERYPAIVYIGSGVLAWTAVGLVIALLVKDIIAIYQIALAFTASALVAPVLAAMFWERATKAGVIVSTIGALVASLAWRLAGTPFHAPAATALEFPFTRATTRCSWRRTAARCSFSMISRRSRSTRRRSA